MNCSCGKTAIYRVGELGYCSAHKHWAVGQLEKFGNPRAKKAKPTGIRVRHVDQPTPKQKKQLRQRELKANATEAELTLKKLLWNHPDTKGLWVFQPIVLGYYPDFLCPKAKLIVELDGYQHYTKEGLISDYKRTAVLSRKGYRVIRFSNQGFFADPGGVVIRIIATQQERMK